MASFRKLAGDEMGRVAPEAYASLERHPVTLMLHNIRSMWNVGSMFRTADGAGLERIVISGYTATPPRPQIEKTALGADATMPWVHRPDPVEALQEMKRNGIRVFGLEITEESRPYSGVGAGEFPACLLVGNEVEGIDDELLALCDDVLEIPQYGTKHSLNVSVAAGIALFELVRAFRAGL